MGTDNADFFQSFERAGYKNIWSLNFFVFLIGNCSYREDCTLKPWGDWDGDIPEVGCGVQVRKRDYNSSLIYVQQENCSKLLSCPKIRDEVQTKCKYFQINHSAVNFS